MASGSEGFFFKEGYAYLVDSSYLIDSECGNFSFKIADLHELTNSSIIGECQIERPNDYYFFTDSIITVEGGFAYTLCNRGQDKGLSYISYGELLIFDCSDLENPKLAGSYCDNYTIFYSPVVIGNLVYLPTFNNNTTTIGLPKKIEIVNVTNPSNPQKISEWSVSVNRTISGILVEENYLYLLYHDLLNSQNGFEIYDMNNSTHPQKVGQYEISEGLELFVDSQLVYILKSNSLVILDISNFSDIIKKGEYLFKKEGWGFFTSIFVSGKYAYVGRESRYKNRAFFILDCKNPARPRKMYPRGNPPLSLEGIFALIFSAIIGGPIILVIIIVVSVILYTRRKRKKQEAEQGEQW